jgi:uncharacterized protein with ParB-like and HNH nuclease domain/predicted transport protein
MEGSMKATETKFLDFLKGPKQFIIPIYQRSYSWTQKQCEQLWKDIVAAATDDSVTGHFVGSVVYIEKGLYQISSVPQFLVIDGQQRLTTLSLLISALGVSLREQGIDSDVSQKKLNNYFLFNNEEDGELRFKLLLTQSDKETLIRLLEEKDLPEQPSRRIAENHRFFAERIAAAQIDPALLYRGLAKLIIVDIALSREHDNPQLIFESLNSTGLELSQADLIRNYVLMGLPTDKQETLYNDHWHPMEHIFGQAADGTHFDAFMRDYLTVKTGKIPNIRSVYEAFKAYSQGAQDNRIMDIVRDVHRHARSYARMALGQEEDKDLREAFADINTLKVDVAYPFFLELHDDLHAGRLSRAEFLRIVRLVESYVFRRTICGIPTNSLNKTFATLARELDKDDYLASFETALFTRDSYRRFPTNEEFSREIVAKDLYNFRNRNYWLRRLENHGRKERVPVEEYTIEHILPQNPNLPREWRDSLGADWEKIQATYLHTLGNLTLTGYNPQLSDRPFREKREMVGGFADSPIRLNRGLAKLDHWGESEIINRGKELAVLACEVWPYPSPSAEALQRHGKPEPGTAGRSYTLADHPHLTGQMLDLFEHYRKRVLNLDASVREEFLKLYIAYKATTNFVDVVPQKTRLILSLNMPFDEIQDPKGICKDVTGRGRWGNGDVEIFLSSAIQLDDVLALVKQAFDKQMSEDEE